jgi:pilus assembly protein CpaD
MKPRSIKFRQGGALSLAALGLALFLAGCQTERPIDYTGSVPTDYRDRHPIRLADKERTLQILVGSGRAGLTATQRAQVAAMGSDWRREGSGYIVVETPARAVNSRAARDSVREIRSLLQFAGVSARALKFRTYDQPYREDLGAIRVSYKRIAAEAGPCGQWPDNLGPGVVGSERYPLRESMNEPYYNFGCATQRNLASSVANPEDLVQPRAETPAYAERRQTVMEKYAKGQDTASQINAVQSTGKASSVSP